MSFTMNGQALKSSKTSPSPPAKRSLELDPEDTSAPKKARLGTSQDHFEEATLFQEDTQQTPLQHPQPRRLPSPLTSVTKQLLQPVDPLDAFVSQWLQSVGSSERTRNCRSDASLDHLQDEDEDNLRPSITNSTSIQSRQRAHSAPPDMERKDNQGFAVPQTPASLASSNARGRPATAHTGPSTSTSRSRSNGPHVYDYNYREILEDNNITMQQDGLPLPTHVASVVDHVRTRQRDSPERTDQQLFDDKDRWALFQNYRDEDEVVGYYTANVFPAAKDSQNVLRVRRSTAMARRVVPFAGGTAAPFCVPTPDLLYGYQRDGAFDNPHHRKLLRSMDTEVAATNNFAGSDTLIHPFFLVEFKGTDGNIWVATNQCLGGSAACVNITESLNRRLFEAAKSKDGVVTMVDNTAFSIAMTGTEAQLFVSWSQDQLNCYTSNIDCYSLRLPDDYRRFRRTVRNIVDWGRNDRLKAIQKGLDQLLEAAEK